MRAVIEVLFFALNAYWWIVIASAIFSWLYVFGVVNERNDVVRMIGKFLHDATEPVLGPIRRIMPNLGSIDISPIILLLGIMLIQQIIIRYVYPYVF